MANIERVLIRSYQERLLNRVDACNQQWRSGDRFGYKAVYQPITDELLEAHFCGQVTISLPALSLERTCKWLAWDSDLEDGSLLRLAQLLSHHGWHTIRESVRPGRDGHLWLLFDAPIPASIAIAFGKAFHKAANINERQIEFFPKQAVAEKLGSALRAPLGVHMKPGANNARGWFVGPAESIEEQLEWFVVQPLNSAAAFMQLSEDLQKRANLRKKPNIPYEAVRGKYRRNILELVPEAMRKRIGANWVAPCPACTAVGADNHGDNLRIKLDGSKFCCVKGGPGQMHKAKDILRAFGAWD